MNYSIAVSNLRIAMLHTNCAQVDSLDPTAFDDRVVIWGGNAAQVCPEFCVIVHKSSTRHKHIGNARSPRKAACGWLLRTGLQLAEPVPVFLLISFSTSLNHPQMIPISSSPNGNSAGPPIGP
jgi:hypothetical protein